MRLFSCQLLKFIVFLIMKKDVYITKSEKETISLGAEFAERLTLGDVVSFTGDLGAGKTEFIKGICLNFKVQEIVSSPTFTIMNLYNGERKNDDISIYHLDLYRLNSTNELAEIGFDECVYDEKSIKLIEWAEKAGTKLDKVDYKIVIHLNDEDEDYRTIEIFNLKENENN